MRLIFRLFLEGDNGSGPMGIKTIVNRLNANGHRTRQGATWGIGPVHVMLSNPVYAGNGCFNVVDSKTGARKADAEYVFFVSPIVIDPPVFERVRSLLKQRNPRVSPPRVVTGPILLTGLAYCATCAGAMTLRKGTTRARPALDKARRSARAGRSRWTNSTAS